MSGALFPGRTKATAGRLPNPVLVFAAYLLVAARCFAGGGPQNLALVVNPNDPDSLEIANCYIDLRDVPPSNVFYVPWQIDARSTKGAEFRDLILKPVMDEIKRRGLTEQIDYLAFSSGFPYLIECADVFAETKFPKQARPMASLNSAAYLSRFLINKHPAMFALDSNSYYSPVAADGSVTKSFSSRQKWDGDGKATADHGMKYLISTVLGVTHGHGNKVEEIIASLRRAHAADGTNPRGTIYFMQNNNIRSTTRDDGFPAAAKALGAIGVKTVIKQGVAPQATDVAGVTTGFPSVPMAGVGLLPGAIVDNLTSYGGHMMIRPQSDPQTRVSEFIRAGAAGAAGAVVEPYAIAAKFPSPWIHVHYARGCTLGEAFYQSIASPAQMLIIGDPLCQPWAVVPQIAVSGVKDGDMLSGDDVEIRVKAQYPDGRQASRYELFLDGVRIDSNKLQGNFTVKNERLTDGWHELRVVAIDNTPIAVQGSWSAGIRMRRGSDAIGLAVAGPKQISFMEAVTINAIATTGEDVHIVHNARRLGVVKGGNGSIDIPAKLIGKGKVRLYGETDANPAMRSKPVEFEIH